MIVGTIKDIIGEIINLDNTKVYKCTIEEYKYKRSIEQNKKLWKIIHLIAKQTNMDDFDVYVGLLEKADAKSDYVITATDLEVELRKNFRGVKFVRRQEVNGKDCYVYKVYIGSSKMNTKEMTELLDIAILTASELNIPLI
jgi:hypothetical protein